MSAAILGILAWIGWAMGAFAVFGSPGLARADEQSEILSELRELKIDRLENEILQLQRDYCGSEQGSRPRTYYLTERNDRLNEYNTLTGRNYDGLPSCAELGFAG